MTSFTYFLDLCLFSILNTSVQVQAPNFASFVLIQLQALVVRTLDGKSESDLICLSSEPFSRGPHCLQGKGGMFGCGIQGPSVPPPSTIQPPLLPLPALTFKGY